MNIIIKDKSFIEKIQSAVGGLVEKELTKEETLVFMYTNKTNWLVQLYPNNPDLDIVENVISAFLLQVKQLKEKLIKDKEDKIRTVYTM